MEASALTHSSRLGLLGRRSPLLKLQGDERLISMIRSGQERAFEALIDRYNVRLLAFCRGMLSSTEDAEAWGDTESNIMAWGDARQTLAAVLARLAEGSELLSCFAGEDAPLDADAVRDLAPEGAEIEWHEGGQPHYWWLIAAG